MPALRRNEVIKLNREWLVATAEALELVAGAMERGDNLFNAIPTPVAIKNIAAAIRKAALKGKEDK